MRALASWWQHTAPARGARSTPACDGVDRRPASDRRARPGRSDRRIGPHPPPQAALAWVGDGSPWSLPLSIVVLLRVVWVPCVPNFCMICGRWRLDVWSPSLCLCLWGDFLLVVEFANLLLWSGVSADLRDCAISVGSPFSGFWVFWLRFQVVGYVSVLARVLMNLGPLYPHGERCAWVWGVNSCRVEFSGNFRLRGYLWAWRRGR